jgi:NAD(P)-dependent dehydrogenase (short-subunit alcohol dehydrogenase family)
MARTADALDALAADSGHPERLVPFTGDVTSEADCLAAVDTALARYGGLDGLVHSAGVSMRGLVGETRPEVFRSLMEVNYFSTVMLVKAALPPLRQRKGHVVAISSITGYVSPPQRSGYAASKHAVQAFMDALRLEEHDRGVHVLTVCPGYVRTNISLNALAADGSRHARMDASTGEGLAPEAVAAEVLDAIVHRKREIYPAGWMEKLSLVLKRVAPPLLDQLLKRRAQP